MADEQNIIQAKREKRRYIPFEAKRPRSRNSCPKCGSINIRKRRDTYDYICHRCRWEGNTVIKVEY